MHDCIVGVVVNKTVRSLDRVFHYRTDEEMYQKLKIGCVVAVPFGKGDALLDAFVVEFPDGTDLKELKNISAIIEPEPLFDEAMLNVCYFMKEMYFCTLLSALKAVTPPGIGLSKTKVNDKIIKGSSLAIPYDDAFDVLEKVRDKAPMQAKIIELLLQNDFVADRDITLLTGCGYSAIRALKKKGIICPQEMEVFRKPVDFKKIKRTEPLLPTEEQGKAISEICRAADEERNETFLIHGVTGSGKTEIFLQSIAHVVKKGKSAIVLVPEISLTPQTVERFVSRFGERVAILHSRLSLGERNDEFKRIRGGGVDVVVGVRSAVFAPLKNLGLMILDEEHEQSYKAENAPAYHARDIAEYRAKQNHIPVVLASATPSIESYARAVRGQYHLMTLKNRANQNQMPDVRIVDMRKELVDGNRSVLSEELKQEISRNLERKEQTILFLNRRGFSTFVSCRNCGYVVKCKHCNISLTYHKNRNYLTCHYCGYTVKNVTVCPECGSKYIRYFGTGTQRVEEEIAELFPTASVLRMDVDTTTGKGAHQQILEQFEKEKTDILIGTQMVAKGLDFPNVTLVGVLAADMSLNLDDYRANERTFDLITQVCGRAGRGNVEGRAILQTYMPESPVLEMAKKQDYVSFYKEEIQLRNGLHYPPFCDIISILFTSVNENTMVAYAKSAAAYLRRACQDMDADVLGPSASSLSRINNKYRWRILIKCKSDHTIREILKHMLEKHTKNKESKIINMVVEVNPNSLM